MHIHPALLYSGGAKKYETCRCAKRGALFLAAIELAWMISDSAIKTMPGGLRYLLNPLLRPARFAAAHARWLGWLAFSYLTVRSMQQGCQHLARLASEPTPPGTPRDGSKELHSTSSSELDAAVSNALAPIGDKCPHCSSTSCHGCCGGPGKAPKVIQVPHPSPAVRSAELNLQCFAHALFVFSAQHDCTHQTGQTGV